MPDLTQNELLLGDNLEILKSYPDACFDLIYLDPPFFSNRNYEVIWGDDGEVRSFQDRWSGGMDHYIYWLYERVEQLYRLLKPTGSLFLHCDWHADAYIRVHILDKLFGESGFRNKIVWKRADTHNDAKHRLPMICDYIYYYSNKNGGGRFNVVYGDYPKKTLEDWYQFLELPDGTIRRMTAEEILSQKVPRGARRFNADNMASPNPRPNLMFTYKGYSYPDKGWRYSLESMIELDEQNRLIFPKEKSQRIMLKRYLDEQKGPVVGDLWDDISQIRGKSPERIGYPTQKPEALLERILTMASHEGDWVLDPFVGGGTTVAVAERLKRRWVGIDQSVQAVKVTELRLEQMRDLFTQPFAVRLHKYDRDTLFTMDPFAFEQFAVQHYGGTHSGKKGGDGGVDGKTPDGRPIQVKQQENIGRNVVDNFTSSAKRFDKRRFEQAVTAGEAVGVIIAFSFGRGAVQEVARLKREENVFIDLLEVKDVVPLAHKPRIALSWQLEDPTPDAKGRYAIRFEAVAESEAGIEFYAWDWAYLPEEAFRPAVVLDKAGHQTQKLAPGTYSIAVKAVDNDGLEAIESLVLKVNGEIREMTQKAPK